MPILRNEDGDDDNDDAKLILHGRVRAAREMSVIARIAAKKPARSRALRRHHELCNSRPLLQFGCMLNFFTCCVARAGMSAAHCFAWPSELQENFGPARRKMPLIPFLLITALKSKRRLSPAEFERAILAGGRVSRILPAGLAREREDADKDCALFGNLMPPQ
jgi:hypothetical protein